MWNYVVLFLRNCKGYVLTEGEIHDSCKGGKTKCDK